MSDIVWNERLKLVANLWQSAATTALGLGILAPTAALLYNPVGIAPTLPIGLGVLISFLIVAICHGVALTVLGKLRG